MLDEKPSELYKKAVKDVCTQYRQTGADADQDFLKYLERHYHTSTADLLATGRDEKETRTALQAAIFVFAAGLITYGRLDVAKDIVKNVPPSGHVRRLATVITALMPLPEGLEVLNHGTEIIRWLDDNIDRLQWNTEKGIYELT